MIFPFKAKGEIVREIKIALKENQILKTKRLRDISSEKVQKLEELLRRTLLKWKSQKFCKLLNGTSENISGTKILKTLLMCLFFI